MLSGSPAKPRDTRRTPARRQRPQHNHPLDIQLPVRLSPQAAQASPGAVRGCSCWERVQVPSPRRREDPLPQPPYVVLMRAPVDGARHQDVVRRSVHREVSNLPSDSDGLTSIRFTAHLPTSAPLSGPGHSWPGIRPVTQQRPLGGAATIVVVSCWLSPTGIRFLGILFPPEDSAIPYGWPTAPPQRSGLCRGFRVPHV
jgi:hypothetical protein